MYSLSVNLTGWKGPLEEKKEPVEQQEVKIEQ